QSPFAVPLRENAKPTVGIPGTRHAFNTDESVSGDPNQQGTQMDALGHFAVLPEAWDGKSEFPSGGATYYGGGRRAGAAPAPQAPPQKNRLSKSPPALPLGGASAAQAHLRRGAAPR